MAREPLQLDTTIEVITPENISFQYRVAGPFRRFLAFAIDLALRWGIGIAALLIASHLFGAIGLAGFGLMFFMILMLLLEWFYGGLLETYWNGQTVGKKCLGLRVLTAEGQPINGMQGIMRNILRYVDFLPSCYLLGMISVTCNRRYQRLGDLACGTVVVKEDHDWLYGLIRIDEPVVSQLAAELPAKFDVPKSLGQALSTYVERRRFFSPARRADIARHVGEPLRIKFGFPPDTSHDLLLCALYYRVFITDQDLDQSSLDIVGLQSSWTPHPLEPVS